MTDPRHPDADLLGGAPTPEDPSRRLGARDLEQSAHLPDGLSAGHSGMVTAVQVLPKGVEFAEPISSQIYAWFRDFTKALKGIRVYADNNEMFHKFVDRAHAGLTELLHEQPELNLSVREDRILFNKDPVHINPDREEGLPFVLYRNAFRRITLLRGFGREELLQLLRALTTDHSVGSDFAGEDLVTALWRLALPHLRYLTIDALTSTQAGGPGVQQELHEDVQRIQASIEDIVAAIYRSNAPDDDIVAGVSITKEDLEALKEIRKESLEDLEMLDRVTERAIVDIPASQLSRITAELTDEGHDELVRRVVDIFLRILFREQSAREFSGTIEVILQLFESMVLGGRFDDATELVERLRQSAEHAESLQEMHIAKHLMQLFASEARVLSVLEAFNDEFRTSSVGDKVRFLRALGPAVAPALLRSLETLTTPGHRRVICDLIVEFGVPTPSELMRAAEGAKWFVVRDILSLAQHHPPDRISAIIGAALGHEHPKVRQHAVGMLRGYARGVADRLLVERLRDEEVEVRLAAARVAAARRSAACKVELELLLQSEGIYDREPRELRTIMASYAAIAADDAVPLLSRILNPSLLNQLKGTDAQVAAAFALAGIPSAEAGAALQRGARSLSGKVRDACKRALAKEFRKGESHADILLGKGLRIPEASTTSPNNPITGQIEDSDPTPPTGSAVGRGNTADVLFTVGGSQDVSHDLPDTLDGAPAFNLDLIPDQATEPLSVLNRKRPSMPRVDPRNPVREEMPSNLPPAPAHREELPANLPPAPAYREELPVNLPPAPVYREALPVNLPPAPRPGAYGGSSGTSTLDVMPDRLPPAWTSAPPPAPAPPRAPTPAPPPSAADDSARAYDEVQRELMAYLGLAEEPEQEPSEATPPPPRPPTFGGAAANSDVFKSIARPAGDSDPAWGRPSGARLPEGMADVLMEPEVELSMRSRTLPSEARTEVAKRPPRAPPDAPTEVQKKPSQPVQVDDLFLEDPEGNK